VINLACTDSDSFDIGAEWKSEDSVHLTIHLSEDGMGDTDIDYEFHPDEIRSMIEYLSGVLTYKPKF
jgi:hypothetical protein